MRLLVWPLILSLLLILGFVEIATPILHRNGSGFEHTLPVHKTLYVQRTMYDDQVLHLIEAAEEWHDATNGDVTFDIKMMPQQDIKWGDGIIVMNVTPDYPEIIMLDIGNRHTTLGLYNTHEGLPTIELVDERIDAEHESAVMLHEMGHSLGLEHPDDAEHPIRGMGSLMFSSIVYGNEHITDFDLKQFCRLYHCDWKHYHGVAEIQ